MAFLFAADVDSLFAQKATPTQPQAAKQKSIEVAESGAVSTSRLALPFKRLWQYVDDVTTLAPSLDEARIYLPLVGGRVVCLDRETGAKLWSSDLGGLVSASLALEETRDKETGDQAKAVFVATRKIAEDGTEAGASIRALDKTTGLTLWARDYPRPFTSPLTVHRGRIYAGSADGAFYALSVDSGEIIWKAPTQDIIRGSAMVSDRVVYFGSDDGALRGVGLEKGEEVFKFQTQGKVVGAPVSDGPFLYFGSGDGFLYAVDRQTAKLRWRSRTGAAIEASPTLTPTIRQNGKEPEKAGGILLVASFDNFVYALSRSTGDRLWKRRLEERIAAAPIVVGDAALVAPLHGDHIAVFLIADGRRVNYYRLERELEIVAAPLFHNDLLLLSTNKGLLVAMPGQASAPPANAQKKN